MSNILILYESVIPTVEMVSSTLKSFSKKYGCNCIKKNILYVKNSDIKSADILVCIRGESPLMFGILKCAGKMKKKRIFMLDDDLANLPKGSFRYPQRKKWLLKCISNCDILLTSNQLIANDYKQYVSEKRYTIIHTDIDEDEINKIIYEDKEITRIVYAASEKHIVFFEKYIHPIMGALYKKYGNRIEFYFLGVNPKLENEEYRENVHCIPSMPYKDYTKYMRNTRFDVGLAPLEVNHFTARKYFNKFLEYTKNGICGIYSDCMPYQLVVKNLENGYLVKDNFKDWFKTISRAIEEKEERKKCVENAQTYIRKVHSKDRIYSKLAEDIPELITFKTKIQVKNENITHQLRHKVFRVFESIYLTIYSLKYYGIQDTKKRIKRKLEIKY